MFDVDDEVCGERRGKRERRGEREKGKRGKEREKEKGETKMIRYFRL